MVGGTLLLELNRILRPGGFFVWSATPVYQKLPEDVAIWKGMFDTFSLLSSLLCLTELRDASFIDIRDDISDGIHVLGSCHNQEG